MYRTRALNIKEQRAELGSTTCGCSGPTTSSPTTSRRHPQLHGLFNAATKQAGAAGGGGTVDLTEGRSCSTRSRDFEDLLGDQAGLSNVDLEAVRPSRAAFPRRGR